MSPAPAIVWFRNDLRLSDHAPLTQACAQSGAVVPVYCVDPRQFGQTHFGFPKTGAFRAQFLLESLADLRHALRQRGSDLVIRTGAPEAVLPTLAKQIGARTVCFQREVTTEEVAVETALAAALPAAGVTMQGRWGHTLYHPEDLPFAIAALPDLFTHFRKAVERESSIRDALPEPAHLPPLPDHIAVGDLPTLADLGLAAPTPSDRAQMTFTGGATAGQARLKQYFWERDRLRVYKETRNGLLHADDSSKLSPWLALGCLSPRQVYAEVQRYEAARVRNDSTYWLVFELLWRDYFRFVCAQQGDRVFYPSGLRQLPVPWQQDWDTFERWRTGHTGFPLVDAAMRELAATGFLSNRARQNVASFLTKNLGLDWRLGAEWFESQLIDYDVCSNYGNWNYTAGVGNDARGFRFFNILKQAQTYDPTGEYVKHWLPELAALPAAKVHQPWQLQPVEEKRFGLRLAIDYPRPMVDLFASAQANAQRYQAAQARSRSA